jgi:hypothetical protein
MPIAGQVSKAVSPIVQTLSGVTYIGVDPGLSGGMAQIDPFGKVHLKTMPRTEREVWEWFRIAGTSVTYAVIERVHAMPGQGVTSMFTFGQGYGGLRMALTAAQIPFQEARPQEWQKVLGVPPRKPPTGKIKHKITTGKNKGKIVEKGVGGEDKIDFKRRLIKIAQQLFPMVDGIDETTADALLIAEFCRRSHTRR